MKRGFYGCTRVLARKLENPIFMEPQGAQRPLASNPVSFASGGGRAAEPVWKGRKRRAPREHAAARRAGCQKTRQGEGSAIFSAGLDGVHAVPLCMAKKRTKAENLPPPRPRDVPAPAKLLKELRDLIRRARGGRAGRQLRPGRALLAGRAPAPYRGSRRQAGRVRGADRRGGGESG